MHADTDQPTLAVIQADREAAAVVFDRRARKALHPDSITMERHHARVIRQGEGDDYDAVQAAAEARHRTTHEPRPAGDLRERLRAAVTYQYMPMAVRTLLSEAAAALATHSPAPMTGEVRPFAEWQEDHGDVLWWKLPVQESPYVGSPLDLGRPMKVVVQIGFEEHDMPITMSGGWPFSDDDEASLYWSPLPDRRAITAAAHPSTQEGADRG